jgi:lipoprotein signal peptidase
MRMKLQNISFFVSLISSIFVDQLSKWGAQRAGWVSLNSGISFQFAGGVAPLLMTMMLIIILTLLLLNFQSIWLQYPLWSGVFFGGAVSNLVDRLLLGGVRDWLPVPWVHLENNIADWAIVVSLGVILLFHFTNKSQTSKIKTFDD